MIKKGDKIRRLHDTYLGVTVGKIYTALRDQMGSDIPLIDDDGCSRIYDARKFEVVERANNITTSSSNTNKIMTTVKSFIKSLSRTEPEKTLIKAGFMDENEVLTSEGVAALNHIAYEAHKDDLKAFAEKFINERDASK